MALFQVSHLLDLVEVWTFFAFAWLILANMWSVSKWQVQVMMKWNECLWPFFSVSRAETEILLTFKDKYWDKTLLWLWSMHRFDFFFLLLFFSVFPSSNFMRQECLDSRFVFDRPLPVSRLVSLIGSSILFLHTCNASMVFTCSYNNFHISQLKRFVKLKKLIQS